MALLMNLPFIPEARDAVGGRPPVRARDVAAPLAIEATLSRSEV
jgi:hypothetical protein